MPKKKTPARYALGLDLSTQSLSAVLLEIESAARVHTCALDYVRDSRLSGYGIRSRDYLIPPRVEGEADQPPALFLAALDALFGDLRRDGVEMARIAVINVSGQQHGHVYLNARAETRLANLRDPGSVDSDLVGLLEGSLAYGTAPVWMTSNTLAQAAAMRAGAGGREEMILLSGSDVPLRFSGPVIRRTAGQFPAAYRETVRIHLLSNYLPAVLTGDLQVPADFANACGTALMDYRLKKWSQPLLRAAADGLPGGTAGLRKKLPPLAAPDSLVGRIAAYFVGKYAFNPDCRIAAGSGDNPQSKVLVAGDLLSLGSSLVNMISGGRFRLDPRGLANAMYDGIGRPFLFACRTNGTLVWDSLRALYGLKKEEYAPAEDSLRLVKPGRHLVFWQPRSESFPPSGAFALVRPDGSAASLGTDYGGLIESTLASLYSHSRPLAGEPESPLYVTGGASSSRPVLSRIAAIWQRPVIGVESGGAALGAAVAGIQAYFKADNRDFDPDAYCRRLLKKGMEITPNPEDAAAFHQPGGYLDRCAAAEAELIRSHPLR